MIAILNRIGLAFLCIALPLVFYPRLEDAYRVPQLLALSLGLLALLPAWIRSKQGKRLEKLDFLVLAYFAWRILTHLVHGWAPTSLLWLAEQLLYIYIYLWAGQNLRQAEVSGRAAFFLGLGGGLAALYGICQSLGLDPFGLEQGLTAFGTRSHGTLGNPDFFGGYLVMVIPLVLVPFLS